MPYRDSARVHERALAFLNGLPDDGGASVHQTHIGLPSVEAKVLFAIDEEIHHRAQLAVYLRMLSIQPPALAQRYEDLSVDSEGNPAWRTLHTESVAIFKPEQARC